MDEWRIKKKGKREKKKICYYYLRHLQIPSARRHHSALG